MNIRVLLLILLWLSGTLVSGCGLLPVAPERLPEETRRTVYREVATKVARCLREGDAWYDRGEYFKALARYREAYFYDPDRPGLKKRIDALAGRISSESGRCYEEGVRFETTDRVRALMAFNRALKINPEHENARRKRDELLRDKELRDQLKERERQVRVAMAAYKGRFEEIQALEEKIDRLLAFDYANQVALAARNLVEADREKYVGRFLKEAAGLYAAGKLDQAKGVYRRVQALEPDNRRARAGIRQVQRRKDLNYFLNLARYRLTRKEYQKAMEFADKAIRIDPRNAKAKFILSKALLVQQKEALDRAKRYFAERDYPRALAVLKQLLREGEHGVEPVTLVSIIKENLGKEIGQLLDEGKALYDRKKFAEALTRFEYVLEIDPRDDIAATFVKKIRNRLETIESLR